MTFAKSRGLRGLFAKSPRIWPEKPWFFKWARIVASEMGMVSGDSTGADWFTWIKRK
jgi:hypothetical protein